MIAFNKPTIPPIREILTAYQEILERGVVTNNGPVVRELESKLTTYTGSKNVLTVTNGTMALHLAIRALKLRGEIVTTPLTFIATSSCIIWEGCVPVFADVDPETLCIDPESIEKKITGKTVGILPVHLYGNVCDIERIEAIANEYGLKTIYDGAMAFGSSYKGHSAMDQGTVTMLSMHAYKVLSSVEGGALFIQNEDLYNDLFRIRYFGKEKDNREVMLGTNAKMSELNAAYGLSTLKNVESEIRSRKKNYQIYRDELEGVSGLSFQRINEDVQWNFAYMPVILPSENSLNLTVKRAKESSIEVKRYFYPAVNAIPFLECDPTFTPVAHDISQRVLCLPNYSSLTEDELSKVVQLFK